MLLEDLVDQGCFSEKQIGSDKDKQMEVVLSWTRIDVYFGDPGFWGPKHGIGQIGAVWGSGWGRWTRIVSQIHMIVVCHPQISCTQ